MNTPDINNKEVRMRLVSRWLDTETTVDEERMLAGYYRSHRPDADEKDVAMLICAMQSMDAGVRSFDEDLEKEYDLLVGKPAATGSGRRILLRIAGVAAAAVIITAMVFNGLRHDGPVNGIRETASATQAAHVKEVQPLSADAGKILSHGTAEPARTAAKPHTTPGRKADDRSTRQLRPVTTSDMIEKADIIESLNLAQNETFDITPVGNASIIRANTVDKKTMTFLAVNSEDDGSVMILAMDNINF